MCGGVSGGKLLKLGSGLSVGGGMLLRLGSRLRGKKRGKRVKWCSRVGVKKQGYAAQVGVGLRA